MDAKLKYKAKKIKLIFFDIDDTLRVKDTGYVPASLTHVFQALKKKGIFTGIASGRAIYGVVPELKALKPDYYAMINGSFVEDAKGRVIRQKAIPEELVKRFVKWTKEVGIDYGLMGRDKSTLSHRDERISKTIDIIYENLETDPDFYQAHPIYQMWTFEQEGRQVELPADLQENMRSVRWDAISSDIILKDASKAAGIAAVVEHLGLKPENVMVFGDGLNDLEAFDYAGISVAMGVSHPELESKADYIYKNSRRRWYFYAFGGIWLVEKEKILPSIRCRKRKGARALPLRQIMVSCSFSYSRKLPPKQLLTL